MVTATRVSRAPWSMQQLLPLQRMSWQNMVMALLMAMVLVSAVTVTYLRCLERDLVSHQQSLIDDRQALQVEWGKLLLEKSTWSNPVHIQQVAFEQGMIVPQNVQMVRM